MKFYNREKELQLLGSIKERSGIDAQMTVVVGRRRIGKTRLLKKAFEYDDTTLYLFVTRKNEILICEEFKEEIERKLQVKTYGLIAHFKDLFQYLMELSEARNFTLIIDEFQDFYSVVEFGKGYATYFSILSLIASSKTSRSEIESILEISVGGYLERMENDFNLIQKVRPMFSKPGGRNIKYAIVDNFLNFWFRFIYKYQSAVEIGNFEYLRTIVERDYPTYSGKILEKYFKEKFATQHLYSAIGTYWEKGNQNEIDIIAVNDFEKTVLVAEVKRKKENISIPLLQGKGQNLQSQLKGYTFEYKSLSLDDM